MKERDSLITMILHNQRNLLDETKIEFELPENWDLIYKNKTINNRRNE